MYACDLQGTIKLRETMQRKKWPTQELVGYVEVMDQTPYLVGGNSEWDPGANHPFFPCLSMALVLWTAENSYARLDYSIIYTCT